VTGITPTGLSTALYIIVAFEIGESSWDVLRMCVSGGMVAMTRLSDKSPMRNSRHRLYWGDDPIQPSFSTHNLLVVPHFGIQPLRELIPLLRDLVELRHALWSRSSHERGELRVPDDGVYDPCECCTEEPRESGWINSEEERRILMDVAK
jgi:hypothetical protein